MSATDGQASTSKTIVVAVNDVNEPPEVLASAQRRFGVNALTEPSGVAGIIAAFGLLSVVDPEGGAVVSWSIVAGNEGGLFGLGLVAGGTTLERELVVASTIPALPFGTESVEHPLTIEVTDDGAAVTTLQVVAVVTRSSFAPVLQSAGGTFAVSESAAVGAEVSPSARKVSDLADI